MLELVDDKLLCYCINNNFPINEMVLEDFKKVEESVGYNSYKIAKLFNSVKIDFVRAINGIEHRNKSCKDFKRK